MLPVSHSCHAQNPEDNISQLGVYCTLLQKVLILEQHTCVARKTRELRKNQHQPVHRSPSSQPKKLHRLLAPSHSVKRIGVLNPRAQAVSSQLPERDHSSGGTASSCRETGVVPARPRVERDGDRAQELR